MPFFSPWLVGSVGLSVCRRRLVIPWIGEVLFCASRLFPLSLLHVPREDLLLLLLLLALEVAVEHPDLGGGGGDAGEGARVAGGQRRVARAVWTREIEH